MLFKILFFFKIVLFKIARKTQKLRFLRGKLNQNVIFCVQIFFEIVLVFDLTSMQDATENCHYPELVGEPLRLELNFTNPLENLTELIVLGERMWSVAVDKFGVVGKNV